MDINSKIKWNPGMVLSSSLMSNYVENMEMRRRIAVSATLVGRFGVMAGMPLNVQGFFVNDHFEIPSLRVAAILPSGAIIDADEDVVVTIPKLEPGDHYLCVGIGEEVKEFENGSSPYVRPVYDYTIESLSGIGEKGLLPIVKFTVQDNTCKIDKDYIIPSIQLSSDQRLLEWKDSIAGRLEKILEHSNFCNDVAKGSLFSFLFHMRSTCPETGTCSFLKTTSELASSIEYFVIRPYAKEETGLDVPELSAYDSNEWLSWLDSYLEKAGNILDGVERTDNEIDIEALKREICESVTETLRNELEEKLLSNIRPAMKEEIDGRIDELLKDYVDGTVRNEMQSSLYDSLSEGLKTSLYDVLYKSLYDALFVPEKKDDDDFMPII